MPGEQVGLPDPPAETKPRSRRVWLVVVAGLVLAVVGVQLLGGLPGKQPAPGLAAEPVPADAKRHEVAIRKPSGPPVFHTGIKDASGKSVTMACAECHKTRESNPNSRLGSPLAFFHPDLKGHHGNLSCVSCHNPADGYATLRLADGAPLPYTEVMQLCAQCHGPQYRDYQHGAHGGMTGHWDLSKGGRTRANCVDCHNPHAPKYPTVQPTRGPNDRGTRQEKGHE
jgi:hypothetical protein